MAKRSVSYRLLKETIADPAEALKENHRLEEIPLAESPANKRLFAGQAYNNPPKWLSFFDPEERAKLERLFGAQAAAVLFVSVQGSTEQDGAEAARWLAVCFGMGFQALRPEYLESQFGLRVALNRIGKEKIRSIDTRRPEDATIQTRSQNSRTGEIFDFGIETNHIILQAITGRSSDPEFGGMLSGSDGLKLSAEVAYDSIDAKAAQIIEAFSSDAYQDLFPWYGKITPVRDRAQIDRLDGELVVRLRAGQLDGIHLAPPEIVDYQDIEAFKFSGETRGDEGHDELRLVDYLALVDDDNPLTLARLKSDKVRVAGADGQIFDRWSVHKCTYAEIELEGTLYVLAADEWYAVVHDFVERVNAEIDAISQADLQLPHYRAGETEGDYNTRAVEGSDRLYLFDKALVRFEGERGRIEFCDLLSEDRQIVHVKRRSRSSLLSHLFMQGYVSAEAFVDYQALRQQIRENIPAIQHLIPEDGPNTRDYEIVFALLHEGLEALPFFSKVALTVIYRQLTRLGYRVSIAWVGTD